MAIWKEQSPPKKDAVTMTPEPALAKAVDISAPVARTDEPPRYETPRREAARDTAESVIASNITIEGKIEGAGHVRLAGRFKGDVAITGDLTIEPEAKLTGSVRANAVVIGGEVEGNIDGAARVELLKSGVLNGDLKAGVLTVVAGSRMRGHAEFGWTDEKKPALSFGNNSLQ